MTATLTLDPPEVAAFWKAIGANQSDSLPRLVFADWLDEREEKVRCGRCNGKKWFTHPESGMGTHCPTCNRTGYVSNGYADLAAALRATADRVPFTSVPQAGERAGVRYWSWICEWPAEFTDTVPLGILDALSGKIVDGHTNWRDYPTAEAAVRDLCAAWVKVNRNEVPA